MGCGQSSSVSEKQTHPQTAHRSEKKQEHNGNNNVYDSEIARFKEEILKGSQKRAVAATSSEARPVYSKNSWDTKKAAITIMAVLEEEQTDASRDHKPEVGPHKSLTPQPGTRTEPVLEETHDVRAENENVVAKPEASSENNLVDFDLISEEEARAFDPSPSRRKRDDILAQSSRFPMLGVFVKETPEVEETSMVRLAQQLMRAPKTPLERIYVIYHWARSKVSYDLEGFLSKNPGPNDAQSVRRSKKAVCQGYSSIFEALCKECNIEVMTITGFAKGFGYNPRKMFSLDDKPDHVWNAVRLDGEWRLVDVTWGAGQVDGDHFVSNWDDSHFLADPQIFANDHFPWMFSDVELSAKWQLLENPVTFEDFSTCLKYGKSYFDYRIETSIPSAVVEFEQDLEIFFVEHAQKLFQMSAELKSVEGDNYDEYVFVGRVKIVHEQEEGEEEIPEEERTEVKVRVYARPPRARDYFLAIYGAMEDSTELAFLMQYSITCRHPHEGLPPFPKHFGMWGPRYDYGDFGFMDDVLEQTSYESENGELVINLEAYTEFVIAASLTYCEPDVKDVSHVLCERDHMTFKVKMRMAKAGYYKLEVRAKKVQLDDDRPPPDDEFWPVLYYLIDCKQGLNPCEKFPHAYPVAMEYGVLLLEPMIKRIPAYSDVSFSMTAEKLQRINMNNKEIHEPKGAGIWNFSAVSTTERPGVEFNIYCSGESSGEFEALFVFDVE